MPSLISESIKLTVLPLMGGVVEGASMGAQEGSKSKEKVEEGAGHRGASGNPALGIL